MFNFPPRRYYRDIHCKEANSTIRKPLPSSFGGKEPGFAPKQVIKDEQKRQEHDKACVNKHTDENETYGNQLLSLRVALNEKELEVVELQQQHNRLINRSSNALDRLEAAIAGKDEVIQQLQRTLRDKEDQLRSQEEAFEACYRRLEQRIEEKKKLELQKKDTEIEFFKAKNSSYLQKLRDQKQIIMQLQKEQEKSRTSQSDHMTNKMDALIGKVQGLESSLQTKDKELRHEQALCTELRKLVWKKECMVAQLQVAEKQLQSTLARQSAAYEALECLREKLQSEKLETEKNMVELNNELQVLESAVVEDYNLKSDLQMQETCLQEQRRQISELQKILSAKEAALNAQSRKFQQQHEENQKLIEEYEILKQEYTTLKLENEQLQNSLARLDHQNLSATAVPEGIEVPDMPTNPESDPCIEAISYPVPSLNRTFDPESLGPFQETNRSDYSKATVISTSRPLSQIADGALQSEQEMEPESQQKLEPVHPNNEINKMESQTASFEAEEIARREQEWRRTEAKMRAELCRRVAQLNEVERSYPEIKSHREEIHAQSQMLQARFSRIRKRQ